MALKCDVVNEEAKIIAQGSTKDMVNDVMVIINSLYSDLLDFDKIQASFFKFAMTRAVNDANSPLWVPRKKDEGDLAIHIPISPFFLIHNQRKEKSMDTTKEVPMMIPDCYDPVAQAERLAMEQDKLMEDTMCCSICRCTLYPGNKYHEHQRTVVCPSCLDGLIEGVEYVGE